MCGRFCLTISEVKKLADRFRVEQPILPLPVRPRYNIAPTQNVLVVARKDGGTTLMEMRWGLIPYWAKDAAIGGKLINARAETLAEKPSFREALETRRCLIPSDGFYEWKQLAGGKQPFRIGLEGGALFAFAGLWDTWIDPVTRIPVLSCTIITCAPNPMMQEIHDRMPVILKPEDEVRWLAGTPGEARLLLVPFAGARLICCPTRCVPKSLRSRVDTGRGPLLCCLPLAPVR